MIPHDRLVAPREHLGVLFEPSWEAVLANLRRASTSRDMPRSYSTTFPNVAELRSDLRRRFGLRGPIVATGHQAEFYHAGVFAKTLAADRLAAEVGGSAVFVCVDSDTPKSDRLVVPTAPNRLPQHNQVPIPAIALSLPVESQVPLPPSRWRDFFGHVRRLAGDLNLLGVFEEHWVRSGSDNIVLRDAVVAAQAGVEAALGLTPATALHISALSGTPAFRAFARNILLKAGDFADAYNLAKLNYRLRNRVRNKNNPVADLVRDRQRIETPFWVLRPGGPRRRLWIQAHTNTLNFFADDDAIGEEQLGAFADPDHQKEWAIERAGWRIRPTVITLSAFCRIFLADVFLHGIGGAKYDEITDELLATFFKMPAAPMVSVTATLRLPLPIAPPPPAPIGTRRESWQNPQRLWQDLPIDLLRERERLVQECVRLRKVDRLNREKRRQNYAALRAAKERLAEAAAPQRDELNHAWQSYNRYHNHRAIANSREYFFGLHDRDTMLKLIDRLSRSNAG